MFTQYIQYLSAWCAARVGKIANLADCDFNRHARRSFLLESMERIKNTAQPEDIAKVFRANGLKSVDMAVVAMTSDEISEKYL